MGSLISLQKLCKIKLLILSCFTSVAFGQLVTHWNGAVTPVDHANFAATAAHLAIKGHPYVYYGKREAEAEPEANPQYMGGYGYGHHLGYSHLGYAGYPYSYYGKRDAEPQVLTYGVHAGPLNFVPAVHHLSYAAAVVPGLVAHPNGAVVPVEPHEVMKARAEHLAAKASA